MKQPLVADVRRGPSDREPFLLQELELGWDEPTRALVRHLLLAQEERYRPHRRRHHHRRGRDSGSAHYFYYYCVYADGRDFAVDVQDRKAMPDGTALVSAKSAFAFHALMPSAYTQIAVDKLRQARSEPGWALVSSSEMTPQPDTRTSTRRR